MAQLAEQPTATTPRIGKQGDPCVMVIFGAAGDLTARLLIPALYNLARADLLSKEFAVLGVARKQLSDEDFRKQVLEDVKVYCGDCINDATWESFSRRFYYFAGDFGDAQLYPKIKERLDLDVRVDAFNLFNRVNLGGVDTNAQDGNFGQSTGLSANPRNFQGAIKLSF